MQPPGPEPHEAAALHRAKQWARWPAYTTLALLLASQAIAWAVAAWVAPAAPFDPDLLDAVLPAAALTVLAAAAGAGWVRSRRLLGSDATRRAARRNIVWAATTSLIDGVAAAAFWAAFIINVIVA